MGAGRGLCSSPRVGHPARMGAVSRDLRHVGQVAEHLCAPQFPVRAQARPCLPRWRVCSRACVGVDETDTLSRPQLRAVLRNTGSCSSPRRWARGLETVPRSKDTAENRDPRCLGILRRLSWGPRARELRADPQLRPHLRLGPSRGLRRLDPLASFTFLTDKGFWPSSLPVTLHY